MKVFCLETDLLAALANLIRLILVLHFQSQHGRSASAERGGGIRAALQAFKNKKNQQPGCLMARITNTNTAVSLFEETSEDNKTRVQEFSQISDTSLQTDNISH